ncbi:MAG TPA: hypothetical protein EYQ21_04725 [Flavobacteriales bacterium]|nr:hypothetical protein [Flavobacteriales bacterium]
MAKSIKEVIEEMAEGARLIDEMRKDGRLPHDFNMEHFGEFRDWLTRRSKDRANRPTFQDVLDHASSVNSGNNLTSNVGKDPSALGWQARASMYNAGSDKKFKPLRTSNANLDMDLKDQAGWDYGTSDIFPEI